ncbi:uncharacterized protein [Nicotiana sylvestris]|uniref:uncharacterized protein n=1 Tax=Nicotiana sylvestris TaxID=4096 RepID=UPI00388CB58B
MEGNEECAVIEATKPNLANMTQAIGKPEITRNFELKQYHRTDEVLGHTFVDGLDEASKMNLDSPCESSCMARPYNEIQLLLNNFTTNDHNWQGDGDSRRAIKQKAAGLIELDDFSAMRADIAKFANQMNRMTMQKTQPMQHVEQMSICCELCGDSDMSDMCPTNPESIYYVRQQSRGPMINRNNMRTLTTQIGRIIPTFHGGGNQPNQNHYRPQGNFNKPHNLPQQVEETTNDLLKKLLLDNQQLSTDFGNLERQMGKLATNQYTRPAGTLPSDIDKNSEVNAVTLRNMRELEKVPKKRKDKHIPEGELIPKVQLKIPLVDVLCEIPKYAKYLKEIVSHKRRLTEFETVALTEECTSRVQNKLPQKLKDPSSFTIPVRIGNIDVGCALCDLGVSINLMPLSLFKQLGLGAPRPTTVIIWLTDYEANELVPIIVGRPLLVTGDEIIKVRDGKMILKVDNEELVFNVYKAIQLPCYYEELSIISVVEVDEQLLDMSVDLDDSLEKALILFDILEIDDEVEEMMHILDAFCSYMQGIHPFEPMNRPSGPPPTPSIEEPPKLELKPLPLTFNMLILAEEKLLRVLCEHTREFGWTMSDIRGISPALRMHKVLI